MKVGRVVSLGLVLLLLALGAWWWQRVRLEHSQDVPIRQAAARYSVDPALVKAVVWRESRFNPGARGRHEELGLMQLQEEAAREWAEHEDVKQFAHEQCLDPGTNTMAGTYYLGKLLRRYRHTDLPAAYALADYNAGRANVLKWLGGAAATNSTVFIEQIGFPQTKRYVQAVLGRCRRYAE